MPHLCSYPHVNTQLHLPGKDFNSKHIQISLKQTLFIQMYTSYYIQARQPSSAWKLSSSLWFTNQMCINNDACSGKIRKLSHKYVKNTYMRFEVILQLTQLYFMGQLKPMLLYIVLTIKDRVQTKKLVIILEKIAFKEGKCSYSAY